MKKVRAYVNAAQAGLLIEKLRGLTIGGMDVTKESDLPSNIWRLELVCGSGNIDAVIDAIQNDASIPAWLIDVKDLEFHSSLDDLL